MRKSPMVRGRPPKPTAVLELNGAFKKDPKRKRERESEPVPKGIIGPYPGEGIGRTEREAYDLIVSTVPDGVLTQSDLIFVWQLATLLHRVWNAAILGDVTAAERSLLMSGLGKLGMNPSERSRLHLAPKEKPKNRWSDVANS